MDNHKLLQLVDKYQSPLYVYDGEKIKEKYDTLSQAFCSIPTKIMYAMKALSNPHILKLLNSLGSGIDAVSIQEVKLALMAGFSPQNIIFTSNSVSFEEIEKAIELGVIINIDNTSLLEEFGQKYSDSIPISIRINPHILAGGHSQISTGHIDSKFGISIHQLRHVQRIIKSTGIKICGLHMHTGSDILDSEVFLRAANILFDYAQDFPDLSFIDFGSGFKVAYKEADIETDIQDLAKKLIPRFKEFCEQYGKNLELWFEPGKFLVSESGTLLVRVNIVKTTTATVFAGVNSGLNHLLRPMMYGAYHHITNISNPDGKKRIYTVVGNICETDTFGQDRPIAEIREGDILCLHNAGAYGFSMSSQYNSRLRPAEVLVDLNSQDRLIRRREEFEDLIRLIPDL